MGVAGPQGRERAPREAIDSKTGVIPCEGTASPPSRHTSSASDSNALTSESSRAARC